ERAVRRADVPDGELSAVAHENSVELRDGRVRVEGEVARRCPADGRAFVGERDEPCTCWPPHLEVGLRTHAANAKLWTTASASCNKRAYTPEGAEIVTRRSLSPRGTR